MFPRSSRKAIVHHSLCQIEPSCPQSLLHSNSAATQFPLQQNGEIELFFFFFVRVCVSILNKFNTENELTGQSWTLFLR